MTDSDYVVRRMDRALDKAIDMAEEKERERGVTLPPGIVGQMALSMFNMRMRMAFRDPSAYDLPANEGWGVE